MKAFLLAAGNGTRLKPLTDTVPKCLLPVAGTPLLGIWLELCRRHGFDEVILNVHAHAGAVRHYVASNHNSVQVTLFEEPVLLGSAGTLAANRGWVSGESCFGVFYADVLTNVNLEKMLRHHASREAAATIGVYRVEDPSRCGIVSLGAAGMVTEFIEKPARARSNLAFSGVMLATPRLLEFLPSSWPADIGFHVLPRLAGKMSAFEVTDFLLDIGTLQNYQKAQETWPGLSAVAAG
jgi:mannose-1-phosphate guanylyltransferase